jgi:carbonic anhydrase
MQFSTTHAKILTFPFLLPRIEDSVREDVAALRESPFIKSGTQIVGLAYDVETGKVHMVE